MTTLNDKIEEMIKEHCRDPKPEDNVRFWWSVNEDFLRRVLTEVSQEAIRGREQEIWEVLEKQKMVFKHPGCGGDFGFCDTCIQIVNHNSAISSAQSLVKEEKTL